MGLKAAGFKVGVEEGKREGRGWGEVLDWSRGEEGAGVGWGRREWRGWGARSGQESRERVLHGQGVCCSTGG
jgi:hypothetical protein